MSKYVQCTFNKVTDSGISVTHGWVPESDVKVGKRVRLQEVGSEEWSEGWHVAAIGDVLLDANYVNEHSRDYKRTRLASDA